VCVVAETSALIKRPALPGALSALNLIFHSPLCAQLRQQSLSTPNSIRSRSGACFCVESPAGQGLRVQTAMNGVFTYQYAGHRHQQKHNGKRGGQAIASITAFGCAGAVSQGSNFNCLASQAPCLRELLSVHLRSRLCVQ
jgi:hypothetical protein